MRESYQAFKSLVIALTFLGAAAHNAAAKPAIPTGSYLVASPGGSLYTAGARTLYRYERATQSWQKIYAGRRHLYRYAINGDETAALIYYEHAASLLHLDMDTKKTKEVPLGSRMLVERLFFSEDGKAAVVYTRSMARVNPEFVVYSVPLQGEAEPTELLRRKAHFVATHSARVVYATAHDPGEKVFHAASPKEALEKYYAHDNHPLYGKVFAFDFGAKKETTLYAYAGAGNQNRFRAVPSGMPRPTVDRSKSTTFIGVDSRAGDFLLHHDWTTGKSVKRELPWDFDFTNYRMLGDTSHVYFFGKYDGIYHLAIFDHAKGELTPYNVHDLIPKALHSSKIYAWGVFADRSYAWLHWGDSLVFLGTNERPLVRSIREHGGLPKKSTVEWAGTSYFVPKPAQFYLGVERGGGRYFVEIDAADLKLSEK